MLLLYIALWVGKSYFASRKWLGLFMHDNPSFIDLNHSLIDLVQIPYLDLRYFFLRPPIIFQCNLWCVLQLPIFLIFISLVYS